MLTKDTDSFDSLVRAIGDYGAYNPPPNVSYRMALIINRMGGWTDVCSWRYSDFKRKQKVFSIIFKQVSDLLKHPSANTLHDVNLYGFHKTVQISPGPPSLPITAQPGVPFPSGSDKLKAPLK